MAQAPPRDWTDSYLDALDAGQDPTTHLPPAPLGAQVKSEMSEADALAIVDGLAKYGKDESILKSGWRGLAEGLAGALTAPGQAIGKAMGMTYDTQNAAVARGVDAIAPEQPTIEAIGSTSRNIGNALGSVGPMLATGAGLGNLAAGAYGFGMGANEMADSLRDSDIDDGAKLGYMAANGLVGIADMLPVGRALRRLNVLTGGEVGASLSRLDILRGLVGDAPTAYSTIRSVATQAGLGAVTEGAQQSLTNALVAHATDQELDLLRGVGDEAIGGGAAETIIGTIVELATFKRRAMLGRAAAMRLPLEEYRHRYATDQAFRADEDLAIGEEMHGKLSAAQDPESTGVTDLGVAPDETIATRAGDFTTESEAWKASLRAKAEPSTEPSPRSPGPTPVEQEVARYDDGTPYPAGMAPNPEFSRRTPGIQESSVGPVGSSPAPSEAAPFQPSAAARAAPSAAAYTPVPTQSGPGGQPVVAITGSREGMLWGGTPENSIGAKSATSLTDVGRALLDFGSSLGDISVQQRMNQASGIAGSFTAGGALDFGYNDVMAGAHEVGHVIHRWVMAQQTSGAAVASNPSAKLDVLPPQIQGEIRSLAYAGHAPGRELSEGFAELARLWLLAPESARAKAPNAARWLENWVVSQPRKVSAALQLVQSRAQDWRFQGDALRSSVGQPPTLSQQSESMLRALPERIVRRIYDDTATLKKFDPRLRELWIAIRGMSRGMLANFVSGKPADFNGNAIPGAVTFEQVMRGVAAKDRHLFDNYIVARMALALEGKGVSVAKAPAEAQRLVDELNRTHPQFATTLDELTGWWAQINKVLADASPTYQAGMDRIAAHDAKYGIDLYAPLHRWMTTEQGKAWSKAGRRSNANAVSSERSGSEHLVKSPTEAFVNEARVRLEQAVYRNLVEQLIGVFDASGGNAGPKVAWMRDVTAEDPGTKALDFGPEGSVDSILSSLGSPEMQGDLVTVKALDRAGNPRIFQMDRRIAELAAQVDPATLRNGLGYWTRTASAARRGLSTTQIVYNLGFQFFTNLALDVPMAYLAPSYFKPHELHQLAGYTAQNVLNNLRAVTTSRANPPKWVSAYERLGLHGSAGLSGELATGRTVTNLTGGKTKQQRLWEGLASFMSIPQRSVQIALMQKAAASHKIDISQPITADEANILRLAARQPVDYNAGGDLSRKWQMVVPFLRPALDSERQLAESMKRNPIEFFAKAGVLASLYSTMRWLFADDELEKRKSGADAMRSITIPTAGGEAIELRVPGEIAWLTLAPIALYQAMSADGQDPSDLAMGAVRNALPPGFFSNPAIQTLLSQAMNRSNPSGALFSGDEQAPVVPNALQGMDGLAQQTPSTAPVAIAFANMAHAALGALPESNPFKQAASSPIRWEAGIRSLLGSNGLAMVEGFGIVPGLAPPVEPEAADLLSGVFRRNGTASWNDRYIREVFELNRAAMQQKATLNGQYEDPSVGMRRDALARTAAALSQARFLATYDAESLTVEMRRALARDAQTVARDTIRSLKDGKQPTAYFGLEAKTSGRRTMYDLNRGAYFR